MSIRQLVMDELRRQDNEPRGNGPYVFNTDDMPLVGIDGRLNIDELAAVIIEQCAAVVEENFSLSSNVSKIRELKGT